jgi:hypothetical protein
MYIPGARERVFRKGDLGEYLVLAVDLDAQVAQIISLEDVPELVEEVPFFELERIDCGISP